MRDSRRETSFQRFFTHLTIRKAITIIIILGFIIFGNALFNKFVWDDLTYILNNPDIQHINIYHLFSGNKFNSTGYYRPIPAVYFALVYAISGSQAFFYHFIQVSLHILNTIILYLFLRRLLGKSDAKETMEAKEKEWQSLSGSQKVKYLRKFGSPPKWVHALDSETNILSFFLALIFLVHSINVESVAYIAATQSELFFIFGILALLITCKENISRKQMVIVSVLLLFSLLSKETGFLFLLLILLFQFLYKRKNAVILSTLSVVTLSVYFVIRLAIGGVFISTYQNVAIAKLSFLQRLINTPQIILYYLTTIFFPVRLAVAQKWIITQISGQNFFLPLLLNSLFFIALIIEGLYLYTHKRDYFKTFLFFFLWFISGLLLLVQIFPLDMTVSDRWMYFPLIGLLGMLGVGIQTLLFPSIKHDESLKYERAKLVTALIGVFLILLLSIRTVVRNTNYYDEITLYAHDIQVQDSWELENDLGTDYAQAGNAQAAFIHLQKSVDLNPYPTNLFNLGSLYEKKGNLQKAKEYYVRAVNATDTYYSVGDTHDPTDLRMYTNTAKLLLLFNENDAAGEVSKKGLQFFPESSSLWVILAISAERLHNHEEALTAADKAKTLTPSDLTNLLYTFIHDNIGVPPIVTNMVFK